MTSTRDHRGESGEPRPTRDVERPDLPDSVAGYYDSYVDLFGVMPEVPGARFTDFADINPAFVEAFEQLRANGFYSDVFDQETSQLLAFAHLLRAGHFAAYWHARAARRAGASWQELSKVVEIGVSTGAGVDLVKKGGEIITRLRREEDDKEPEEAGS